MNYLKKTNWQWCRNSSDIIFLIFGRRYLCSTREQVHVGHFQQAVKYWSICTFQILKYLHVYNVLCICEVYSTNLKHFLIHQWLQIQNSTSTWFGLNLMRNGNLSGIQHMNSMLHLPDRPWIRSVTDEEVHHSCNIRC